MKINSYDRRTNFGIKYKTENILEIVSGEPLSKIGRYENAKQFVSNFYTGATGHFGYWKRAQLYVPKILQKYPAIESAANEIALIRKSYPQISEIELRKKVKPLITKLGQEIDIEI